MSEAIKDVEQIKSILAELIPQINLTTTVLMRMRYLVSLMDTGVSFKYCIVNLKMLLLILQK